ncbi:MAG TPA: MmgE/PrpD family protein, partial [Dehalococcoidia bacterium]|nr:MmgE/PrpD family protein [Dehalococcoidia bacterium]
TKEEADHSLPYMVAVAILDDRVMPEQYLPARIQRPDVQTLLRKVSVRPSDEYSRRFPDEMACHITVHLHDGRVLAKEKRDSEGFFTRPMEWATVVQKFERLSSPYTDAALRRDIVEAVANLDEIPVSTIAKLLNNVKRIM